MGSSPPEWQGYARYIDQRPKLLIVREMIITAIDFYSQFDTGKIAWRPAIYLYVFLASVLYYAFLNEHLDRHILIRGPQR
jgi:hypothetical protein